MRMAGGAQLNQIWLGAVQRCCAARAAHARDHSGHTSNATVIRSKHWKEKRAHMGYAA
jgi:hypothetical protein